MDPITTSALAAVLLKVLDGASGEAGRQVWTKFTDTVQRAFGRRSEPAEATRELAANPGDEDRAEVLAGTLLAEAERDEELRAELGEWFAEARRVTGEGDVTNVIGGNAQIHGNAIQARDISGDITFGSA